jgi:hypothetical protein
MTAGRVLAGALSCAAKTGVARPTKGRLSGLSGLTRKCHGPFLGGGAAATPPRYPTGSGNSAHLA